MSQEDKLRNDIYKYRNEICYLNKMENFAMCPDEKNYFFNLIDERTEVLINEIGKNSTEALETNVDNNSQTEFTIDELANYDGTNGKPAYVAVNGIVYDMSSIAAWGGGSHFGLRAGKDLSSQFMACHLGIPERLNKLPKVGILINS